MKSLDMHISLDTTIFLSYLMKIIGSLLKLKTECLEQSLQ